MASVGADGNMTGDVRSRRWLYSFFSPPDVLMFVMLTIYPEKAFLSRVRLGSYVLYS